MGSRLGLRRRSGPLTRGPAQSPHLRSRTRVLLGRSASLLRSEQRFCLRLGRSRNGRLEAAANRQTHLEVHGRQKGPRNEVLISPTCRRHRNLFATQSSSALQTGQATEAHLAV